MQSSLTIQHPESASTDVPDLSQSALAFLAAVLTIYPIGKPSPSDTPAE